MVQAFTANGKYDAYTYDTSSQTYNELNYSLAMDTTTSRMNAVGINPIDGTAYGVLGPINGNGTSHLVRWDPAGHIGYVARVPEFSLGGDFDHHGNFIMIADEVRSQPVGRMYLWAISHIDQLKAYTEPTAGEVADLTGEDPNTIQQWAGTNAAYGYLSEGGLTVDPALATVIATANHTASSVKQQYGQYDFYSDQEHSVYPGFDLVGVQGDFEGDGG
jgi:hypothetical protein